MRAVKAHITRRLPALTLLMLIQVSAFAQQEWSFSQYLFNLYDINAAYAGNHQTASFALRHRSQWIGIEGAPSTQQVSFHAPVAHGKVGAGLRLQNEQIGARKQQMAKASGAYKLHFKNATLSFAVAGGMLHQSLDKSKLTAPEVADAQLANLAPSTITPLLDAAVFFNTRNFYTGIEASKLNRSSFGYTGSSLARLYYNLAWVAGYMHKVGDQSMIQLSGLVKFSEGMMWQSEMNFLYLHRNLFWVGAGYRLQYGVQAFACFNINEHFRVGISYDMATGMMRKTNDGSAELFLGYTLKNRSGKSVRYF